MTGTLPSIPLAQNIDENGVPQSGCRLFLYEANTSTPVISYKDYLLSTGMEHSFPIVADAYGRIPMFWLADGYYRARMEDRYGTPLYDEASMPALGTGTGAGGPAAPAVIQFSTGDYLWQPATGVRVGWVRSNARSIGNALSGASERANADCANLFAFFWNGFPNAWCAVSGGRGASAAADFDANKTIATLDMRGIIGGMGLSGMGNILRTGIFSAVPIHLGGDDVPGSLIGYNAQTMSAAEMPSHTHAITVSNNLYVADPGHSHIYLKPAYGGGNIYAGGSYGEFSPSGGNDATSHIGTGVYLAGSTWGSADYRGGSASQNNVPYSILGTWYVRL